MGNNRQCLAQSLEHRGLTDASLWWKCDLNWKEWVEWFVLCSMAGIRVLNPEMGCYGVLCVLEKVEKEEREFEARWGVTSKVYRELKAPLSTAQLIMGWFQPYPKHDTSVESVEWHENYSHLHSLPQYCLTIFSSWETWNREPWYKWSVDRKTHLGYFKEFFCKALSSMCALLPEDLCFPITQHPFTSLEQNFVDTPCWQP